MSTLATLTLVAWAVFEVALRVREAVEGKGRRERDRGTRVLIAVTLGAAIGFASAAASLAPALRLPGAARAAGVAVMWVGLGVRIAAVVALGGAFRTTVEVEPGQAVVSTGPYRWIRHPAYAGLLLIAAGFGLSQGNALSLAVCALLPLPAVAWRIRVEEAELDRVLGEAYAEYRTRTARLVPGLW